MSILFFYSIHYIAAAAIVFSICMSIKLSILIVLIVALEFSLKKKLAVVILSIIRVVRGP